MARTGPRIRYKANGTILGKRQLGRKAIDAVTGFYSYEALLTQNDFGDLVDPRGEGNDIFEGLPATSVQLGPPDTT